MPCIVSEVLTLMVLPSVSVVSVSPRLSAAVCGKTWQHENHVAVGECFPLAFAGFLCQFIDCAKGSGKRSQNEPN